MIETKEELMKKRNKLLFKLGKRLREQKKYSTEWLNQDRESKQISEEIEKIDALIFQQSEQN